jgi:glycosyltransferase involved in cell wall biosynthesis
LQVLPVVVAAAELFKARAGVDFEDSFADMRVLGAPPTPEDQLWMRIEKKLVPELDYVTAASPGVAEAVVKRHGITPPVVVLNTFPLAERPSKKDFEHRPGPLRLYWVSQTVGRDRGLRDAIKALSMLPRGSAELHLRGQCNDAGRVYLQGMIAVAGMAESAVVLHEPAAPHRMVSLAADYDVGLALETPVSVNRIICMRDLCTNKIFTYLLGGLALAATSEHDSREVFDGAGFVYPHGQPEELAAGLRRWLENPAALRAAKEKAWRLGETQFNWDLEKVKLVTVVKNALSF